MHKYINEILVCWFGLCFLAMTGDTVKVAPVIFAYRKLLLSHSRVSSRPLNNGPDNQVKIHPHASMRCAEN